MTLVWMRSDAALVGSRAGAVAVVGQDRAQVPRFPGAALFGCRDCSVSSARRIALCIRFSRTRRSDIVHRRACAG
jgi:hypothetical protein